MNQAEALATLEGLTPGQARDCAELFAEEAERLEIVGELEQRREAAAGELPGVKATLEQAEAVERGEKERLDSLAAELAQAQQDLGQSRDAQAHGPYDMRVAARLRRAAVEEEIVALTAALDQQTAAHTAAAAVTARAAAAAVAVAAKVRRCEEGMQAPFSHAEAHSSQGYANRVARCFPRWLMREVVGEPVAPYDLDRAHDALHKLLDRTGAGARLEETARREAVAATLKGLGMTLPSGERVTAGELPPGTVHGPQHRQGPRPELPEGLGELVEAATARQGRVPG